MTTKQFIEKAIDGGWTVNGLHTSRSRFEYPNRYHFLCNHGDASLEHERVLEEILLDPEAWVAVGHSDNVAITDEAIQSWASLCMHGMIDAIIDGKSIEEYLETL